MCQCSTPVVNNLISEQWKSRVEDSDEFTQDWERREGASWVMRCLLTKCFLSKTESRCFAGTLHSLYHSSLFLLLSLTPILLVLLLPSFHLSFNTLQGSLESRISFWTTWDESAPCLWEESPYLETCTHRIAVICTCISSAITIVAVTGQHPRSGWKWKNLPLFFF